MEAYRQRAYSYRRDPAVPVFPDDRPVIVFDGHCVLCSGFARFVMRHDRARRFRLLAAQSPLGAALYRHYGLDPVIYDTNILLEQGIAWFKSEAGIRIVAALGFPYTLARLGRWVPWRDALYAILARNRLRWFGSRGTCFLPDPADRDRFLA